MMIDPEAEPKSQEQDFEWVIENGQVVKSYGGNGRKCECCGCNCPCRCECCKKICCTFSKKKEGDCK